METFKTYSANWDDDGWWTITYTEDGIKFKAWLVIEGEPDDPRAKQIATAMNNELEKATDEGIDLIKNFRKGYLFSIEELHKWNGGTDFPCHIDLYNRLLTMEKGLNERASELLTPTP